MRNFRPFGSAAGGRQRLSRRRAENIGKNLAFVLTAITGVSQTHETCGRELK